MSQITVEKAAQLPNTLGLCVYGEPVTSITRKPDNDWVFFGKHAYWVKIGNDPRFPNYGSLLAGDYLLDIG